MNCCFADCVSACSLVTHCFFADWHLDGHKYAQPCLHNRRPIGPGFIISEVWAVKNAFRIAIYHLIQSPPDTLDSRGLHHQHCVNGQSRAMLYPAQIFGYVSHCPIDWLLQTRAGCHLASVIWEVGLTCGWGSRTH